MKWVTSTLGLGLVLFGKLAFGQAPSEAATPATPEPGTASSPSLEQASEAECLPNCRDTFTCVRGTCVSVCNPPCEADETCTADAQCVPKAPRYPSQSAPADEGPPPFEHQRTELSRPVPGARTHDGFFLRVGLGLAYGTTSRAYEWERTNEFTWSGVGPTLEFSMGGTVTRNITVGGGIYHTTYLHEDRNTQVALICPFVNYYLNPREGLHFTAGPCWAAGLLNQAYFLTNLDQTDTGIGFTGGIGYEAWTRNEWSAGALLRLKYARPTDDDAEVISNVFIVGISAVATYH